MQQGAILVEVAVLVDAGRLRTTLAHTLSPLNAATLREAHAQVETGHMVGKVVVENV